MGQFFKMFFAALLAGVVLMILPFILMIGFFSALASLGSQPEPMVKPASTLVIDLSVPIMDRAVEDPMAIFTSFSTLAGNVSMPVSLRSLEEVRQKDILRLLAADEKNKGIVSEVLRRLVTDVRDEVLRSAEAGLKGTAETLKETAGSLYQAGQKALEKRK